MTTVLALALDSYGAGVILIGGSTALSVLGLLAVRRVIDSRTLSACHEVGSSLLSVVGTLYAVILGLIVVDAMGKFQEAHQDTEQEANALADLVILSEYLPREKGLRVRALAANYADLVTREEWPALDRGRESPAARRAALALVDAVADFEPVTESHKATYAAALTTSLEFWNNRRSRIAVAARGIPALEWISLIGGGVITIAFTYFFVLDRLRVQVVMTAMVSLIISLNIYLVSMFGHPYSGDLKIDPAGFRVAQSIMADREEPSPTR